MYWVSPKDMVKVIRNPNNHTQFMTKSKAQQIFKDIHDEYIKDYPSTWNMKTVPLEYFVNEYVKKVGVSKKLLTNEFMSYFENENENDVKNEVLLEKN